MVTKTKIFNIHTNLNSKNKNKTKIFFIKQNPTKRRTNYNLYICKFEIKLNLNKIKLCVSDRNH